MIGVFVLIGIIGAIAGSGDDETAGGSTSTAAAPAAPAPQEPQELPEPVDTGRMSEGEWSETSRWVDEMNGEIDAYVERVSTRCAVLIGGGEVAATLECLDEAYEGVEDTAGATTSVLDDNRDDVGGQCLVSLNRARAQLNRPLFQALGAHKRSAETLDGDVLEIANTELAAQNRRWRTLSQRMLSQCRPQ